MGGRVDRRSGGQADGRSVLDRRQFLAAGVGLLLTTRAPDRLTALLQEQDTASGSAPNGRLYDPSWIPSVQPVTARDNDKAIQAIEKRIKCTCGCGLDVYTCRTTDFTCPVSPKMHAQVLRLAEAGNSGDQIIAAFVQQHGVEILMAPPRRGFFLIGYYAPYTLIAVAGAVLIRAMSRWVRRGARATALLDPAVPGASAAELERLREALQQTDA